MGNEKQVIIMRVSDVASRFVEQAKTNLEECTEKVC